MSTARALTPARHSRRRPVGDRPPAGPRGLRALLAALGVVAALAAAVLVSPGAARAAAPSVDTPPGAAWIRAGHFVPGFGAARVDLTPGSGAGTSIVMSPSAKYGDVTGYQKITPGTYTVSLRPQGAAPTSVAMLERSFTVAAGSATTIAALGSDKAPRLAVLTDDLTAPAAGTSRVRVFAAAANVPSLTVTAVGGPTLAAGAVLGQTTGYTTVPQGSWHLTLGAGTASASAADIAVAAGRVYTAVVLDSGTSAVTVKLVTDATGTSATPAGGARTGGGWLATHDDSGSAGPLVGVVSGVGGVALLSLAVGAVVRSRSRRAA